MQIKGRRFDKNGSGYVVLIPEEPEDLWIIYNLIHVGDHIRAVTWRRISKQSDIGKSNKERKKLNLEIAIEKIDFTPEDGVIRLSGPNMTENEWVKIGAYQSLTIENLKKFTLTKEYWDSVTIDFLNESLDPANRAEVAALLIDEGLANLVLITPYMTIDKFHLSVPIPKKRKYSVSKHDGSLKKFFENVYEGVKRNINFDIVKCLIIAGPGFVKDQFHSFVLEEAQRRGDRDIQSNKDKFLLIHGASAYKNALSDIMSTPAVVAQIEDTKASGEVQLLETFFDKMKEDENIVVYGPQEVRYASDLQAIEHLLISDQLFRSNLIAERKASVELVESVKEAGGNVVIFSSLNVAGEKLQQLSGVAAILRYPLLLPTSHESTDSEDSE
eukprot:TRINITY_DN2479_c0_g1_i1.p1 TRINITY_DN2479_c0_g1~~TRINITY_DN2479_c0_g1_i1.p1  ORF type:complete len:386 (-),score=110.58 TRINITY_DN2479_c0_g1_i1:12-1169(-)